ncbi:uncharacterized protein CcaverHIS019_0403210 [Cutaneotrichosporon cavernicola]|uniref:ATP-dependent DNA helicase PIF1 n=1 Tax=Cutaneotrichosporon cavernicola TaxID=279322 RepID=A0AA48QVP0_9TREE|nr:uncharacterized protein CcaverHIS019_0403210 [Cutaneotrichosporon cavernicola]BEI91501.1 hypothetical protein CcaverHIS019_0403210 [Cutaneotrichosporon cavernicola]BEI99276.1 hypothetical protein CcaverHIS631_0403190 [Cutaneotrichosporon cavernicola]BEJ07053.1 hypothetical protein CcaverHIS641_0403220 [Cutaneotrichosporon cavernicola]
MPSFLTSASAGRGISRVNSFSRDWGEEEQVPSSAPIEWSPSPPRVKHKLPFSAPKPPVASTSASSSVPDDGLTPQERRRRAILEALSPNPSPATTSAPARATISSSLAGPRSNSVPLRPSSSTLLPSSKINFPMKAHKAKPLSAAAAEVQALPELPTLDIKKRLKPWEDDFSSAKKVMETGGLSRTNSSSSVGTSRKKTKPSLPTVNIRNKLVLSTEQQEVLKMVVDQGRNIFFTGSAGAGKSVLLREIIKSLHIKYAKSADAVAVTASTGIAACNIGGVTLHSFGGMGLATEEASILANKVKRNKKAAARWSRTKVLIIDEISMVDAELFDKFNKVGQIMRKKPGVPFGGMQLICTGDFFQLPPVTKNGEPRFCFESTTWTQAIHKQVNLSKVFRQKDERFVNMLNEMRFGRLTPESIETFRRLDRPIPCPEGIVPTELFPRREDVDRSNMTRLRNLSTETKTYVAQDGGVIQDKIQRDKMLSNFMAPQSLELRVDAQVMLIKNIDETLVNGSMGRVLGFCEKIAFVTDTNGRWREGGVREDIQSRDGHDDEQKEKMLSKYDAQVSSSTAKFPVVRFSTPGGGVRDMFVEYDQFKNELPNGEVQVSRAQLPLILAWAMSIHKAQGQTLERVKVDLSKVFEKGQAYVALSRATSLEGLQVRGFRPDKVMAHRKVAVWSRNLDNINV